MTCRVWKLEGTKILRKEWMENLHVRGPQSQIVTEKLHYQGAVLVWILSQCIQLCNGFIKSLIQTRKQLDQLLVSSKLKNYNLPAKRVRMLNGTTLASGYIICPDIHILWSYSVNQINMVKQTSILIFAKFRPSHSQIFQAGPPPHATCIW